MPLTVFLTEIPGGDITIIGLFASLLVLFATSIVSGRLRDTPVDQVWNENRALIARLNKALDEREARFKVLELAVAKITDDRDALRLRVSVLENENRDLKASNAVQATELASLRQEVRGTITPQHNSQ